MRQVAPNGRYEYRAPTRHDLRLSSEANTSANSATPARQKTYHAAGTQDRGRVGARHLLVTYVRTPQSANKSSSPGFQRLPVASKQVTG